ncbi:LysR family transcriptional regulator [Cumulibacter soli]|uniref:LysR family transcriptional regulator n=1 Tax=Cumulibacter soli TaxID=2546344 RepID=UPI001067D8DA|nr:LysR family transcriptional regulator [Cumulibacter soli]
MTRPPDPEALRLFMSVVDLGSIGAAARAEQISQPTASTRIAALERHLGVTLLRRTPAGSRLTDDGRVVAEWATEVLRAMDDLTRGVEALRQRGRSRLRLAASQTVAEFLVPRWLSVLRADQPEAKIRLHVGNSAEVIARLRRREADLGFVESPRTPDDLHSINVGEDELVLVGPAGTPSTTLSAEDLLTLRLITREVGSGTRDTLERAIGRLSPQAIERASNSEVKLAVMSGAGHAVLSRLAVGAEIADGRLVHVPLRNIDLRRALRALVPPEAAANDLVRDRLIQIAAQPH